jgi:predicted transcriptional regulator YdeE
MTYNPQLHSAFTKTTLTKPEIKLVGISARTSYDAEVLQTNSQIVPCVQRYFHGALFEKIPRRKKPGTTFCVYTEYESDYRGAYTYFIGEEVISFPDDLPEGFQQLLIPKQQYVIFTAGPAPMPDVVIRMWQEIWKMSDTELGGKRPYIADFEVYDERAADHQNVVLDVYVAIT